MSRPHGLLRAGYPYLRTLGMRRITNFPTDIAFAKNDTTYILCRSEGAAVIRIWHLVCMRVKSAVTCIEDSRTEVREVNPRNVSKVLCDGIVESQVSASKDIRLSTIHVDVSSMFPPKNC